MSNNIECKYTSPSKKSIGFSYKELSRQAQKKVSVHEYPGENVPGVQDLGQAGWRFPIKALFSGINAYKDADQFIELLSEHGAGILEHPRWGTKTVVPIGYTQVEDWTDGIKTVIVNVEFVESAKSKWPTSKENVLSQIDGISNAVSTVLADDFPSLSETKKIIAIKNLRGAINGMLRIISNIGLPEEALQQIYNAARDLSNHTESLFLTPAGLINSLLKFIRIPKRTKASIISTVKSYELLLDFVLTELKEPVRSTTGALVITSAAECSVISTVKNRKESVYAVSVLGNMADRTPELNIASPVVLNNIRIAVSKAKLFLLNRLFELKVAKTKKTRTYTNPIALSWELYGDISKIDELIESAGLKGEDILLTPPGVEVIYYD